MNNNINSKADEIQKSKELLDQGVISKEEFEKLKQKCLESDNLPQSVSVIPQKKNTALILVICLFLVLASAFIIFRMVEIHEQQAKEAAKVAEVSNLSRKEDAIKLNSAYLKTLKDIVNEYVEYGYTEIQAYDKAKSITMEQVMDYSGLTCDLTDIYYRPGVFDDKVTGTINYFPDGEQRPNNYYPLTGNTKLGDIGCTYESSGYQRSEYS